jgi:c(7)-type cytochrome triheme protein
MKRLAFTGIIALLMLGCSPAIEQIDKKKAEENPVNVISADEAIGELPCFKCHSYQKFSASPQTGIFSHQLHSGKGYHCNQCHDVQGHKHLTVNKDVCNNCHSIKTITFNRTALPSLFDHNLHSSKYSCKKCHPSIFIMSTGAARVTMKDINNGAYCGACHDGKEAFPSSDCNRCHDMKDFKKELRYRVDGIGNVAFSHEFHTSAFSCDDCHPKLFSMKKTERKMTMDDMNKGNFCGSCHNGNIASSLADCGKCHQTP